MLRDKPKFERKPNREIFLSMSKDNRYCIVKIVESWVLPRNYVHVVLREQSDQTITSENTPTSEQPKAKGK